VNRAYALGDVWENDRYIKVSLKASFPVEYWTASERFQGKSGFNEEGLYRIYVNLELSVVD
tara:strand:+ start:351 stop:533 length:183 start_codon:yes stop_codon:yes gene_type:complete